ncbi:MAG TPA: aminotransferase class V-fold PLP-dependent enzyme [Herpetosiphonaceae bacterium]
MSFDVAALRAAEFPVTQRFAYFNSCATAPLPARAAAAAQRHLSDRLELGTAAEAAWFPCIERTRGKLARFINAAPEEVALVKNTSEGLGIVAQAVPWRPGDVILAAEGEFAANVYPWRGLERLGVELRLLPAADERIAPELFAAALADKRVRMVAVSWVQYHTGYRTDLAALGELCRRAGVLLCVDAIQGLGGLALDLQATPVDFCAFGGNKWLLSLHGAGGLYVSPRVRDQLQPANVGWLGADWPNFEIMAPDLPLKASAAQYEEGTRANIAISALEGALDLLAELGAGAVEAHVRQLTDELAAGIAERGGRLRSRREGGAWSGIVAWSQPGHEPGAVARRLEEHGVLVTVRDGSLRAAAHCFNSREDVARLLAALPA